MMLRIRPTMKMGMPLATSPMMMMVISSAALRARLSNALTRTRINSGAPTAVGKYDHVISDEPTIHIE